MRKLGIAVLVIVVLVVAAALIVPRMIDINQYHNRIQAELQKRLGRTVTLGEMRLSLFPPSFQVQNPVIGEDPKFSSNQNLPFATAEKLAVSIKLMPLLHKDLEVKSLELDRPHIELVRDQQGTWNFATLGQEPNPAAAPEPAASPAKTKTKTTKTKTGNKPQQSAKTAPAQPSAQPAPQSPATPEPGSKPAGGQLTLANLSIVDGQVAITDLQKHQSRAVYDHIDASVNDFAPNKPFSMKVAAHLPPDQKTGGGKQLITLQGKGGPIQQADLLNTPFDGSLKLDQVSVAAAQKFLNSQALSGINALITGDTTVRNSTGKLSSNGNIQLQKPRIKNVDVGYPITLNYDLTDDLVNDVIEIRKGDLRLGETPVSVSGTLNTRPNPSQIDLKLTASNASIEEAARLAAAFGVAFGQEMDVKGTVNANISATGPANKLALNGQLSARNVDIRGKSIPEPVKISEVDLALTPATIKSNDFSATAGSTTVNANFTLNQYTSPQSAIDATLRAPNARVAELLDMAKAAGVSAAENISGDGVLTLDVHAQGPTKNMSAMAFNGTGKLQNATLKMPSLPKPVQVRNADLGFNQNSATVSNLAASMGQANAAGNLTVKNFAAPQVQFTLNADKLDVAELLELAKAAGVSATENISGDGVLTLNVRGQGPTKNLSAMMVNGTGKLQNATLKMPSLPKPVQVRNADLGFNQNSATVSNLAASMGQANAAGNLTVKNFAAPQVQFTLNVDKLDVAELLDLAKAAGVSATENISGDGVLTLNVRGQGPTKNLSALVINGTGKLQNATLKLASLTKPIQVRNADLGFSQNSATLSNLAASVGQTNATGNLTLKNFAAPQVQFTLNADKVDVAELQQLTAAPAEQKRSAIDHSFWQIVPEAEAQTHPAQPNQPATENKANEQSILNKMTGGGTATIGSVKYNDLLLSNVHSNITLDRGVVRLNPLTADVYNGKETGNITIDLRPPQPVYTVALKTDKVDANKLVSSVSDIKQTLYGLLNSNVNATFSSTSANEIARSLNGQLVLDLTDGKLMNVDLLHELASVGKFLGSAGVPAAPRGFTNIAQLSGNFDVKNGLAQTNNLKAVIDGGTMAATGLVNLADQSLNMHVTAVLNKALSQQVGGTQIGGFMNTALANNEGELVIPVIVTGTFQHPAVAPDLQQLAQMKLKNLLPTSKNPGQLTTGIVGQILGGKNQGQNNGGQQPQGGLSGILGAISGKQQQQQQQQPNAGVSGNEGQQQQPATGVTGNEGQQPQQSQPETGAAGNEGQQQPQAQPTPTPNPLGGLLDKVLGGKKSPSPTPTPTPQRP